MRFDIALIVLALSQGAPNDGLPRWTRRDALRTMALCELGVSTPGCSPFGDLAAEHLAGLYWSGDKPVLVALIRAGRRSDAALSTSLGGFYGDVLLKEPQRVLLELRKLGVPDTIRVAIAAADGDGSGLNPSTVHAILQRLTAIAKRRGRLQSTTQLVKRHFELRAREHGPTEAGP